MIKIKNKLMRFFSFFFAVLNHLTLVISFPTDEFKSEWSGNVVKVAIPYNIFIIVTQSTNTLYKNL